MTDFIAKHVINAPNSYARAYNPGDPVSAQVVTDWALQAGIDVEPADDYVAPRPTEDSTDRAAWESYVTGQGTSLEDARDASLAELRGMYEPPVVEPPAHDLPANAASEGVAGTGWQNPTPVTVPSPVHDPSNAPAPEPPERPADSALKADWVDYAVAAGADYEWAHAKDTTKDDLIAWEPRS
jgi:hypothetical protein